jgi:hypothetical protein
MANRRMIGKSISVSKQVNSMSLFSQHLFTWMIAHADDWGRMSGDPDVLRATVIPMATSIQLLPLDWDSLSDYQVIVDSNLVDCALNEMTDAGLIERYDIDGERFLVFPKWDEHQTGLHKRTASRFPELPGTSRNVLEIPSQGKGREQKGTELKGREGNCAGAPHSSPLPLAVATYLDSLAIRETTPETKLRRMVSLALRWSGVEEGQDSIPDYSDASAALVITHWCKTQLAAYREREGAGRYPGLAYFEDMIREYCSTGRLPGEHKGGNGKGAAEAEDLDAYCRELVRKQNEHPERYGLPKGLKR